MYYNCINYIFLARDQTRVKGPRQKLPFPGGFYFILFSFFPFWYGGNDIPWLEDVCSGISR